MRNRTNKKRPLNRGDKAILERLRSIWQERQGSNLRPSVLETDALPIELHPLSPGLPRGSAYIAQFVWLVTFFS